MKKKMIIGLVLLGMFAAGFAYAETVKDVSVDELKAELKTYSGKILLLNFLDTKYPQSQGQLVRFKEIAQLNTEIKVVAVAFHSADETLATVQEFADKFSLNFPVYITDESYSKEFGISVFPTTLIVGEQGDILEEIKYAKTNQVFQQKIKTLTNKELLLTETKLPELNP